MQDPSVGNAIVIAVLVAGAFAICRGVYLLMTTRGLGGTSEAAERGRARCMAWVVAGCLAVSIPGLVFYVATPPEATLPAEPVPASAS